MEQFDLINELSPEGIIHLLTIEMKKAGEAEDYIEARRIQLMIEEFKSNLKK